MRSHLDAPEVDPACQMPEVYESVLENGKGEEVTMPFKTLREIENGHIVLWLIKDTCWCTGFKPLGMLMIIPTLAVAAHITWSSRNDAHDLWTNIAVCFWIMANAVWMTGEFYFNDGLRPVAYVFFALGLLSLVAYYGARATR